MSSQTSLSVWRKMGEALKPVGSRNRPWAGICLAPSSKAYGSGRHLGQQMVRELPGVSITEALGRLRVGIG